jgi:hypothetical protein
MAEAHPTIAQAVVTDPLESSAGGYVLVAKSPGIMAQDAEFLSASPGISDYLQELQATDDSYFSFFTLPSKKYALVRRFIHGERRGVNRVVVHLLVVSDDLLRSIQENIWLLIAGKFQEEGKALSLTQLGDEVGKPGIKALPDLSYQLPAEQSTFEDIVDKRKHLVDNWSEAQLRHQLIGVLEALVRGKRVLLPQSMAYRELLALAWLSLPIGDRRRISWTTHFTQGRVLFRLANAPDPKEARLLYPKMEECILLKEIDDVAAHAHEAVLALSARIMTETPSQLEALYHNLQDSKLSLIDKPKELHWNLRWWDSEHNFRYFLENGASTLAALSDNLSEYESMLTHSSLSLDGLEINVLYGICQTGSNLSTSLEKKLEDFYETIRKNHRLVVKKCLEPALVAKFISHYGSPQVALIAMGLAWRRLPALPLDYADHQMLFSSFFDKYLTEGLPKSYNKEMVSFLAQLSFELIIYSSIKINQDAPALLTLQAIADSNKSVLDNTLAYLGKNQNPLQAAIALLKMAGRVERTDIVADIMIRIIFPSVTKVSEEIIIEGIESSQGHPEVISQALNLYSATKPFNKALSQFKALVDSKPKEAKNIITEVLADNESRLPLPFYESQEIKGLTGMLDKLDIPIDSQLRFILIEAEWAANTRSEDEKSHFKKSLSNIIKHKTPDETRVILNEVKEILAHNDQYHHRIGRLIFEGIAPGAAVAAPEMFHNILEKALSKNDKLEWKSIVKEIYEIFIHTEQKQWAVRLAKLWWKTLSDCDWKPPSETELNMLELIGEDEFLEIITEWMPRLGDKQAEPELFIVFKGFVDKFAKREHPAIYMRFAAYYIASQKRRGELKSIEELADRLCSAYYAMEQPSLDIFIKEGFLVLFNDKHERSQLSRDYRQNNKLSFVMKLAISQLNQRNKIL